MMISILGDYFQSNQTVFINVGKTLSTWHEILSYSKYECKISN